MAPRCPWREGVPLAGAMSCARERSSRPPRPADSVQLAAAAQRLGWCQLGQISAAHSETESSKLYTQCVVAMVRRTQALSDATLSPYRRFLGQTLHLRSLGNHNQVARVGRSELSLALRMNGRCRPHGRGRREGRRGREASSGPQGVAGRVGRRAGAHVPEARLSSVDLRSPPRRPHVATDLRADSSANDSDSRKQTKRPRTTFHMLPRRLLPRSHIPRFAVHHRGSVPSSPTRLL